MHRLEFPSFPNEENNGPHPTTRTSCRSFVLTRAIPSCTEDATKSERARQTDQFWENASRLTRTCGVQEGRIPRPAKTPCPRSLGTSKPRPDRPLGDRRSSKPTPYAGMQHDNGRRTRNDLRRRPPPLLHRRNAKHRHPLKNRCIDEIQMIADPQRGSGC